MEAHQRTAETDSAPVAASEPAAEPTPEPVVIPRRIYWRYQISRGAIAVLAVSPDAKPADSLMPHTPWKPETSSSDN